MMLWRTKDFRKDFLKSIEMDYFYCVEVILLHRTWKDKKGVCKVKIL